MRHLLLPMLISAVALTGCPADPLPTPEAPDASDLDMYVAPDGRIPDVEPPDERIIDAMPIDQMPDMPPPPDFGPLPDLPDPAIPPALADTAVLVGRTDTWVGWIIARRLFAARIDTLHAADPPGAEPPADGGLPMMDGPQVITGLPEFADRLRGVRTPNGRPWVLVPDGADGMLRAHDLSQGLPRPQPLQLWPPVRTAISGESILIVGRASPEANARIATVHLDDDGPRDPVEDHQGIPLPSAISPGLSGWVFAFPDGICQLFLATADPETDPAPGNFWRCGARADISLIGDSRRLYAVGDVAGNLRAWTTMPGAARTPSELPLDDDPRDITLAIEADVEVLHAIPGGQALRVETAEGAEIHLLTPDQTWTLPAPADEVVLGAARFFQSRFLVLWDPALGRPIVEGADAVAGPTPPVDALGCRPLPEVCNDPARALYVDLDCVNGRENALCCRDRAQGNLEFTDIDVSSDDIEYEDAPVEPWFIVQTPAAPMMIVAYSDRLDLLRVRVGNSSDNEGDGVNLARFEGIERIERFGQSLSQVVVHGHRGAPPPADPAPDAGVDAGLDAGAADAGPDAAAPPAETDVLAWYLGRIVDVETAEVTVFAYETPAPCTPILHLTMRDGWARVYCTDSAIDVPFDQEGGPRLGETVAVPYPAGDVRWIGPPLAEEVDQVFLAATGDDHTLRVWRDTPAGDAVADEALPPSLLALAPDERTVAIRLPESEAVYPARIVDHRVQVHVADLGWMSSPSTLWPRSAVFSATDPMALTLAEITNPEAARYDPLNASYTVMLHGLERETLHWGQPVTIHTDIDLRGIYTFGVRFADYDAGQPLLWYAFGDEANIKVRPRGVACNPAILGD